MLPTQGTLRPVNPITQDLISGYFTDPSVFIADKCLPLIPNSDYSGTYQVLPTATSFGDIDIEDARAPGANVQSVSGVALSSGTFQCAEYALESLTDMVQSRNAQLPGPQDLKFLASQQALTIMRMKREIRVATMMTSSSIWTQNTSLAAAAKWKTTTSNPLTDIRTGVQTVMGSVGKNANTLILGYEPWNALLSNPSLKGGKSYGADRNALTEVEIREILANYFGIDNIFYGLAQYNTANMGQTSSLTSVWGDYVWVGYMDFSGAAPRVAANTVALNASAAVCFENQPLTTFEYDVPQKRSVALQHSYIVAEKVLSATSGYLIQAVTA